jgi:N6-adenosine-specific RNA methylase IME4
MPYPSSASDVRLQRILIEVGVALQGNPRKSSVIERSLQFIGLAGMAKCQVHVSVEKPAPTAAHVSIWARSLTPRWHCVGAHPDWIGFDGKLMYDVIVPRGPVRRTTRVASVRAAWR